jgi:hypothetical protein
MWWHTVTHGRGSEGETGEWSGLPVPFTLPRNMVCPALLPLMRTPRLPVVDWTDAPADLSGLVRFAERRNLVSARVLLHFNRSLLRVPSISTEGAVNIYWGCRQYLLRVPSISTEGAINIYWGCRQYLLRVPSISTEGAVNIYWGRRQYNLNKWHWVTNCPPPFHKYFVQ